MRSPAVAAAVLFLAVGGVVGSRPDAGWTAAVALPKPLATAPDVPLVIGRHRAAGPMPHIEPCTVYDYVGVPDGRGGTRPDYRSRQPEEQLPVALPNRRGYHWVEGEDGSGWLVYASGGRIESVVTVEFDGRFYGITHVCGDPEGPPDFAWRP